MYFIPCFDPTLRFECMKCGNCCGRNLDMWLLELYPTEVNVLKEMNLEKCIIKKGSHYFLARKGDGSCIFLNKDNLCKLRLEYDWYPVNCRIFPFSTRIVNDMLVIYLNIKYIKRVKCNGFGKGDMLGAQVDKVINALREVGVLKDYFVVTSSSSSDDNLKR
ncbi:MAG: hypothetical protein DRZ82_03230 [Thermoprotei archaeon]|nr:MAG: hypothetical protein DRZ82_03230 [Thermoprotei archaeon]